MKNKIAGFLALLLISSSFPIFATPIKSIKFATEATYPPFETISPAGEIQGLDIDIAKALCKEIDAVCTFINQPFDGLIPSLKLGKFDAVIASMTITAERKKEVAFTTPYLVQTVSFVAPIKSSFTAVSTESLKGKTIGVQAGTTLEQYLLTRYKDAVKVNTYASETTAFIDLEAERIDGVLGDTLLITHWLKQYDKTHKFHIVGKPIDDELFKIGDGIAVKLENIELLKALNDALAKIKADGSLDKITQKYLVQ